MSRRKLINDESSAKSQSFSLKRAQHSNTVRYDEETITEFFVNFDPARDSATLQRMATPKTSRMLIPKEIFIIKNDLLAIACEKKSTGLIKFCIQRGSNVDTIIDKDRNTLLHYLMQAEPISDIEPLLDEIQSHCLSKQHHSDNRSSHFIDLINNANTYGDTPLLILAKRLGKVQLNSPEYNALTQVFRGLIQAGGNMMKMNALEENCFSVFSNNQELMCDLLPSNYYITSLPAERRDTNYPDMKAENVLNQNAIRKTSTAPMPNRKDSETFQELVKLKLAMDLPGRTKK